MSNLLNGFMHRPFEDNKYFGYKEDDAFEKKRHFCVRLRSVAPDSVIKSNQFKANNKTMSEYLLFFY